VPLADSNVNSAVLEEQRSLFVRFSRVCCGELTKDSAGSTSLSSNKDGDGST
jgi:hypothetical protein